MQALPLTDVKAYVGHADIRRQRSTSIACLNEAADKLSRLLEASMNEDVGMHTRCTPRF